MRILLLIFLLGTTHLFAQEEGRWTTHLPYNTVTDIAVRGDQYFCAANQGMFMYDAANNEINTYSKLSGLNDIGIGAIAYNEQNDVIIIGYQNANVDLVQGNNITNLGDIKRASGFIGKKRINHITTKDDAAWLSTGFGIVKIDLVTEVVDETYIIGPNGSELEVYQTAIDETANRMYAATPDGLYSADLNSPLIFFQFWQKDMDISAGEINGVAALNGRVFANKVTAGSVEDSVFYQDGTGWQYLAGQTRHRGC